MLPVFLSAVRRVVPLSVLTGGLVGLVLASAIVAEDGTATEAVVTFAEVSVVVAVAFTAVISTASTLSALRAAHQLGVRPDADILKGAHTAEATLTGVLQRHPNHVLDSLLDRMGTQAEVKRRDIEDGGAAATAELVCRSATGFLVAVAVRVDTRTEGFTVLVRTAPAQTWKKPDGGASWEVLRQVMTMVAEGETPGRMVRDK